MTNYIDNTTDDATTYKGKIDESLDLLRGVPVSSTTSGGSAGVDYEVSEWASLTLTTGIMYVFRAHTTNTGPCHVDQGGSPVNIKTIDGNDPTPGFVLRDSLVYLLYDGTNLVLFHSNKNGIYAAQYNGDLDSLNDPTIVYASSSSTNKPPGTTAGRVIHLRRVNSGVNFSQLWLDHGSSDKVFYRRSNDSGVFDAWVRLLTTTDLEALRLTGTGDASLSSTTHAFQIGETSGLNIIADINEIMARNNGNTSGLLLNADGGDVSFGQNLGSSQRILLRSGASPRIIVGDNDTLTDADLLDEDDFASNSATKGASQQSIKAYVDERGGKVATGSFTTANLTQDFNENNDITHGLGTDNVLVSLMATGSDGSNYDDWEIYVKRPDGSAIKFIGPKINSLNSVGDLAPASGDVRIRTYNRSASSQTITVQYRITAID